MHPAARIAFRVVLWCVTDVAKRQWRASTPRYTQSNQLPRRKTMAIQNGGNGGGVIDFQKTFGARSGNVPGQQDDRPKAQLWLNIGYLSDVVEEDTGERRFVSLPTGIPLDTQEHLPTNSRNRDFAAFQSARNDLLEQVVAVGKVLEPGESKIICLDERTGLAIQIRRVNGEQEAIEPKDNQYVQKLNLAANG